MGNAYWAKCEWNHVDVQQRDDCFIILMTSHFRQRPPDGVYHVVEVPLDGADKEFAQALDQALNPVIDGFETDKKLARAAASLKYYSEIDTLPGQYENFRNKWGATRATVHVLVGDDSIRLKGYWAYELAHESRIPLSSQLLDLVGAIRQAFELTANQPKTRFHHGAEINIVRRESTYWLQELCIANASIEAYRVFEAPHSCTDSQLGQNFLNALTALPRFNLKEFKRQLREYDEALDEILNLAAKYPNGKLSWDGGAAPDVLSFYASMGYSRIGMATSVPVDATPSSIGKMVRTTFEKVIRHSERGRITNDELVKRLDRLRCFEFTKRKAAIKKKMVKDGWSAIVDDTIIRAFHADEEDLAEGGVGNLFQSMQPFFKAVGVKFGKVRDEVRDDGYDVRIDKKCYPILFAADFKGAADKPGFLWGIAGYRTSLLLNRLLRAHGREECAYSLDGGNDHSFLLITEAMHSVILKAKGVDLVNRPYRSSSSYPGFGQALGYSPYS